jgi:heat shock protein HslJ
VRRLIVITLMVATAAVLAACSSGSGGLTGKDWQLTAITEKVPAFQGVVPPADQGKYTITFNTDGTFNGSADCNRISGTYTTSGSSLTITMGASTMAFCPEGSYGDLYAHALGNAASYAIAKDVLTITLKDGGTLTFVVGTASPSAAPSASAPAEPSSAPASPAAGLTGKTWKLTAVTEKVPAFQGVVPPDQQASYTIEFKDDGTFGAKADCNQVAGTYTTTASGGMTLTLGATTLAMCAEGSYSDLYMLGLGNASSYAIANNELTITLADGGTLVFK